MPLINVNKINVYSIPQEEFISELHFDHWCYYFWAKDSDVDVTITYEGNGEIDILYGDRDKWVEAEIVVHETVLESRTFTLKVSKGMMFEPRVLKNQLITKIIVTRVGWWKSFAVAGAIIMGVISGFVLFRRRK
ncbi:hypothetical protein ES707_10328 [subsurface metagenome]